MTEYLPESAIAEARAAVAEAERRGRFAAQVARAHAAAGAEAQVEAQAALADLQAEAIAHAAETRRLDLLAHPHDDDCPNCGRRAWDDQGDPQRCVACGARICPECGADFAEDYAPDGTRLTDCLGEHVTQWHNVPRWAEDVLGMIKADMRAGLVPLLVGSFTALHDHRDANEYVIAALAGAFPVPEHYGDEYHDGSKLTDADQSVVDAETDAANAVMAEVDRRLAATLDEDSPFCQAHGHHGLFLPGCYVCEA